MTQCHSKVMNLLAQICGVSREDLPGDADLLGDTVDLVRDATDLSRDAVSPSKSASPTPFPV